MKRSTLLVVEVVALIGNGELDLRASYRELTASTGSFGIRTLRHAERRGQVFPATVLLRKDLTPTGAPLQKAIDETVSE